MGFIDNVSAAVNRGTAATSRATRKMKLQGQLNDVNKRRQGLAAQLGASLYDVTKNNPEMREGRESLFEGIARCDEERESLQRELNEIEQLSAASAAAVHTFNCVVCGARMSEADLFCSGCGTPVAQAKPQPKAQPVSQPYTMPVQVDGPRCPSCGALTEEGDMFCMSCGVSLGGLADASQPVQPQGQPEQPIEADAVFDAHVQAEQEPTHPSGAQAEQQPTHLSGVEDVQPVSQATDATACVSETESSLESVQPEVSLEPQTAVDPEFEAEPEPACREPENEPVAVEPDPEPAPVPAVGSENVQPEPTSVQPEPAVVQTAAPACPSCGKPIRETDRFCMYCGQRL